MTNEKTRILPPTTDFIFKQLFGNIHDTEILSAFLKATLDIPDNDIENLTITDPHLHKGHRNGKLGIIDVRVRTKSKRELNVEIQVQGTDALKNRIEFYNAKMLTGQMTSGTEYDTLQQTINIVITCYNFIDNPNTDVYHHCFVRYDMKNQVQFSDLTLIHTLELPKLPSTEDSSKLWEWLKFLSSTTKEEFTMIAEKDPTIKKAVNKLTILSEDERNQMIYDDREKARMDANARERFVRNQGIAEGMSQGLTQGISQGFAQGQTQTIQVLKHHLSGKPANEIATLCNLPLDEVESIIKQFG